MSDENSKKPEVLPSDDTRLSRDLRDEIEIRKAEAEATISVVEAIGAQLRTIAEAPGVQEVLKGFGKRLETGAQQALDAQKQAHDRQMQADRLAAERDARRDRQKNGLLVIAGAVAIAGVWLVASGHADPRLALTALALLSALGVGRIARPPQ